MFKLWLTDQEFFGLLEALDNLETMAFSTDREFNSVLGVPYNWTKYIVSIAVAQAKSMAKGATLEDIVTDVVSGILMDAKEGGLQQSIQMAKENNTGPELLNAMKKIIMQAAEYRISDARRWTYRTRAKQFSQLGDPNASRNKEIDSIQSYGEKPSDQSDFSSYGQSIVNELGKMKMAAESKRETKLAKRLAKAAEIVPDRLAGLGLHELMDKHEIKSKATAQAILDDIYQALARVASRLQDPTLMAGTKGIARGG